MKAEPLTWLCWTLAFALFAAFYEGDHGMFDRIVRAVAFFFLAASGGQLAIENAKARLLKGKVDEI